MRPLSTDELRKAYIDFFVQKHGHAAIAGASLIPENDPTVLFTTAGMHPLVPYLLGEKHPSGQRLTSCQRCVRTQDIDEVGDSSHCTFFEMLGNWSLGSASATDGIGRGGYFKEGAIRMSFQFLTEVLEIPMGKLAISCFSGDADAPRDEESARVWESLGIPHERVCFLPKAKNWWGPAGHTGPCGPDTEMFFWVGSSELPPPGSNPANDEKNWLEIWNDVFMEYERKEIKDEIPSPSGGGLGRGGREIPLAPSPVSSPQGRGEKKKYVFAPLRQKNVDTGMGLERVAAVLQGVGSVYETDRMKPILDRVQEIKNEKLKMKNDGKITTDYGLQTTDSVHHARIITDHVRAATFILADGVLPSNVDRGYVLRRLIRRAIRSARALGIEHNGAFAPAIAREVIAQYGHIYRSLRASEQKICSILEREEQMFGKTLQEGLKHFYKIVGRCDGSTTLTMTHRSPACHPEVRAERATKGDTATIIAGAMAFHLYDTYGFPIELTRELAAEQGLTVDEAGFAQAFAEHQKLSRAGAAQRFAGGLSDHSAETTKLHTATHLLNAALRKVLGPHVQQRGSNITAERLRFDFSHPTKVTPEQIAEVERLVNTAIAADLPVTCHVATVEKAKADGAIGVFDEKYGAEVKVYVIGPKECHGEPVEPPFSREICGGPHVARTGMLGTFTIQKEEAISAGVRRIKAVVAGGA